MALGFVDELDMALSKVQVEITKYLNFCYKRDPSNNKTQLSTQTRKIRIEEGVLYADEELFFNSSFFSFL